MTRLPGQSHEVGAAIGQRSARSEADDPGSAPLCWGQRWSWHEQQLALDQRSPTLHATRVMDLPTGVGVDEVRAALRLVVTRHTSLRSTYALDGHGTPRQTVWPTDAQMYELTQLDGLEQGRAWLAPRDLDIGTGWPLRAAVGRAGPGVTSLGIVVHHIAVDRQGFDLLCAELVEILRAGARGVAPALSPPDRQPVEIAEFEQSPAGAAVNARALDYWQRHDHEIGSFLSVLRAGFDKPSSRMHVARVASPHAARRLAGLASGAGGSEGAVAVAAVACVLAGYLGREVVPMTMLIANRHHPGYRRSVCSLAESGLLSVSVPDAKDLEGAVAQAWPATMNAMRHGYYDGDQLSERMTALDSGGRHSIIAPPSVNAVRLTESPVEAGPPGSTGGEEGPYALRVGQVDRPCVSLNFHIGISDSHLSIELRAGTHLVSEDDCAALVVNAMRLLLG